MTTTRKPPAKPNEPGYSTWDAAYRTSKHMGLYGYVVELPLKRGWAYHHGNTLMLRGRRQFKLSGTDNFHKLASTLNLSLTDLALWLKEELRLNELYTSLYEQTADE